MNEDDLRFTADLASYSRGSLVVGANCLDKVLSFFAKTI